MFCYSSIQNKQKSETIVRKPENRAEKPFNKILGDNSLHNLSFSPTRINGNVAQMRGVVQFNSADLRRNLGCTGGEDGCGGEAHHIVPESVFLNDSAWNGILLNGWPGGRLLTQAHTNHGGAVPAIFHKSFVFDCHPRYNAEVNAKLSHMAGGKNVANAHALADDIRPLITGAAGGTINELADSVTAL